MKKPAQKPLEGVYFGLWYKVQYLGMFADIWEYLPKDIGSLWGPCVGILKIINVYTCWRLKFNYVSFFGIKIRIISGILRDFWGNFHEFYTKLITPWLGIWPYKNTFRLVTFIFSTGSIRFSHKIGLRLWLY